MKDFLLRPPFLEAIKEQETSKGGKAKDADNSRLTNSAFSFALPSLWRQGLPCEDPMCCQNHSGRFLVLVMLLLRLSAARGLLLKNHLSPSSER